MLYLTTNNDYSRHQNLVACYQLDQFISKIGYALAERDPEERLSVQRALTIECSLMSGCGQVHELVKDMLKKLWLKFPGLTHSRSSNTGQKSCDNSIQDL